VPVKGAVNRLKLIFGSFFKIFDEICFCLKFEEEPRLGTKYEEFFADSFTRREVKWEGELTSHVIWIPSRSEGSVKYTSICPERKEGRNNKTSFQRIFLRCSSSPLTWSPFT